MLQYYDIHFAQRAEERFGISYLKLKLDLLDLVKRKQAVMIISELAKGERVYKFVAQYQRKYVTFLLTHSGRWITIYPSGANDIEMYQNHPQWITK